MHHHWPRRNVSWSVRRQCLLDFQHGLHEGAEELCVCAVCGKGVERQQVVQRCIQEGEQLDNDHAVPDAQDRLGVDAFLKANQQLTAAAVQWYRDKAARTFHCCLHPDGIVDYERQTFAVCPHCNRGLKTKKPLPPSFALANNFWFGALPVNLPELTVPEQLVISRHHVMSCIIELQQAEGTVRRHRGNCIAFAQEVQDIAEKLPRTLQDIAGMVQVVFVGRRLSKEECRKHLEVRRSVVRRYLQVLREFNWRYAQIPIDEDALRSLPDDEAGEDTVIPEMMEAARGISAAHFAHEAGYVATDAAQNDALQQTEGIEQLVPVGMVDLRCMGITDTLQRPSATAGQRGEGEPGGREGVW